MLASSCRRCACSSGQSPGSAGSVSRRVLRAGGAGSGRQLRPGQDQAMAQVTPLSWSLVIPVKELARAKSRLTGLAGPRRAELALAMAADTVAAAAACPAIAEVIVVTDDAAAGAELGGLGACVVPDEPGAGLNPALVFGAAYAAARWPG